MSSTSIFQRISDWLWQRTAPNPDLRLVLKAARGRRVDRDDLAAAYWRMYYATYRPRKEWHTLPRGKRGSVYRVRLRLIGAYAAFSPEQRDHVSRMRPRPPRL